ncbi:3-isopropylmalate dehydrogenase [Buchnera aphidicola]|uniref:3-isopropylmalate dehydrogenase n=1 Tax=Buchnera aphidicola TaxID=9 RepID=UPI0030EC50BA
MKKNFKIAILSGDGIGPEIMKESIKIIDLLNKKKIIKIEINEYDIGGIAIDKYNEALPKHTLNGCKNSDSILLGSVGGPKWTNIEAHKKPEIASLLPLRKYFNLFVNLRPSYLHPKLYKFSPLKKKIVKYGFNIICVRELISGIYYGLPKGRKKTKKSYYAFDTSIYKKEEIERIANFAFQLALKRKKKITSIDKSNVLETSKLWKEIVIETSKKYPEVNLSHLYFDNAVMQIIKNPKIFDILLCPNLIGDVISDECGILTGSIGMLPSASLNTKNFGIYEPAGGSAPDIAGQNIANPIAQILSLSMLLKYSFNLKEISTKINYCVEKSLLQGYKTYDLDETKKNFLNTNQMGDIILKFLAQEL